MLIFKEYIIFFQAYTIDLDEDGINDKLKGRIKFSSEADKVVSIGIIIPLTAKLSVYITLYFIKKIFYTQRKELQLILKALYIFI